MLGALLVVIAAIIVGHALWRYVRIQDRVERAERAALKLDKKLIKEMNDTLKRLQPLYDRHKDEGGPSNVGSK